MSDTTGISQAEYNRALQQAIQRKARIRELESKLKEQDDLIGHLTNRADQAEKAAADARAAIEGKQPSDLEKTVAELRGELKSRDFKAAWEKTAREFKTEDGKTINPEALDALWKLAPPPMDGEAPDPAALSEALRTAVQSHGFVLRAPEPVAAEKGAGQAPGVFLSPKPAPAGAGRGTAAGEVGLMTVRKADMSDGPYMARNQAAIAAASRDGRLNVID